jgi:hypothetical protein
MPVTALPLGRSKPPLKRRERDVIFPYFNYTLR